MIDTIKNFASLYRQLGFRWSAFRLAYALRLRSGLIRLQTPQYQWSARPLKTWLKKNIPSDIESYAQYRKNNSPKFFFNGTPADRVAEGVSRPAINEANKLLSGEIKYFFHQFYKTGFPPNWHAAPISNFQFSKTKHWSQISDDTGTDIKFVWEANRFAFVYALVRAYAATHNEKYAQAFWTLIEDWAKHNPPNTGANWKDGQEISLRLMAWVFGYYAFIHSPSATPFRIAQFTQYAAAQAERIYKNIGYAVSTKSNHAISEGFGLWMVGLLFPELRDSEKYFLLGKKILEGEVRQILPDGSYAMYSLNYHRFVLHIYLYAICLGEMNRSPLSAGVKQAVSRSVDYLSNLIDFETGQIPFYGPNDGALVLPLNACDFTDFRPLLQLGSYVTQKKFLFQSGAWDEDVLWLCGQSVGRAAERIETDKKDKRGKIDFPNGGIYILRNTNSKAVIHCRDFASRPSHADQLHLDLWVGSRNVAIDAGTYLYSGEGVWRNGLARTSAHNTVTVDHKDQMTLVSRFTWTNWAKGKVLKQAENLWQGEHDGYKPIRHKRTVMALEGDRWLVIDDLEANEPHHYTLHWLLNDVPFTQNKNSLHLKYEANTYKIETGLLSGESKPSILRADANSTYGWRSRYYGHKEPAISLLIEANQPNARFYTFFGFEGDVAEIKDATFEINNKIIQSSNL